MSLPEEGRPERISEAEHAVMEALWSKAPLTAAEVADAVGDGLEATRGRPRGAVLGLGRRHRGQRTHQDQHRRRHPGDAVRTPRGRPHDGNRCERNHMCPTAEARPMTSTATAA